MHRRPNANELLRRDTKIEKGATAAPFYRRVRSAYRFLPAFFFPPLAFFAIVCYPPLHVGIETARALPPIIVAAAWHAHSMSALHASGNPPRSGRESPTVG